MADIFISYARADQPRIEKLAKALERAGYSVWWDRHIRVGEEFSRDIENAIAEAKAVVVAWSKFSAQSEWVREEASFARDKGNLVPIRLDKSPPPFGYRQRQAIDFSNGFLDPNALEALTKAIGRLGGIETRPISPVELSQDIRGRLKVLATIVGILLIVASLLWFSIRPSEPVNQPMAVKADNARSVAVLPFHISSPDEGDRYLADAIAVQVLDRLDALPDLKVAPRTASFALRESPLQVAYIGKRLGVDHLVEGDVLKVGNAFRVTARLVQAADGKSMWSETYEADGDTLAKVQLDISEQIATSLDILLDESKRQRMAAAGVENVRAFAKLLKIEEASSAAHAARGGPAPIYQVSRRFEDLFNEEPQLWQAAYQAADAYAHVMFGRSGGRTTPAPGVEEVWDNAHIKYERLLAAARSAARRPIDRAIIEHSRLIFSDDWTGLGKNARLMFSKADTCDGPIYAKFVITFGAAEQAYEYFKAKQHCMRGELQQAKDFADFGFYLGRHEEVLASLERMVSQGIVPPPILDEYRFLYAMYRGRTTEARRINKQMGDSNPYFDAIIRGDRAMWVKAGSGRLHEIFPAGPELLAALARAGFKDEVAQLAAKFDALPEGPTVLHLAHAECNCGPLFDLSATPRYASRLKAAGAAWPPRVGVRWPLKNW